MIQYMVVGSIKFQSVSLFTIILSDVKIWSILLKTTFS
jgi:hypothetical protein